MGTLRSKYTETNTPVIEKEARGTSRLIHSSFGTYENGFVLYRNIEDDDSIAPENSLTRMEYYAFDGVEAYLRAMKSLIRMEEPSRQSLFEPRLPLGLENYRIRWIFRSH